MSSFSDFLAAIEHGAASVYHQVLSTGTEIVAWGSDPAVAPLLTMGAGVANAALERVGVRGGDVVAADIAAGLKSIAAADPTVPSMGSLSALLGLAGNVVSVVMPGAAGIIAGVEGLAGVAESLIVSAATPAASTAPAA
jgi:hypothetical protein